MVDLLRLYGPGLLGVIIACLGIIITVSLIFKYAPKEVIPDQARKIVKTSVKLLITVIVLVYAFSIVSSLSTNVTPRGVIDRSQTLDQQKAFEQRHTQQKGEMQ